MRFKAIALGLGIVMAWALKKHYAEAGADDLWWILTPTAQLVGVITGVPFTHQPGEGYFSRERLFLIEQSCAGVNFMVAAFAMLVFTRLHHASGGLSAARMLGLNLLASYAAAVATNAVRIAVAMWLAAHPPALTTFNAAELHRIEGIAVYFGGLVLVFDLARRSDRGECTEGSSGRAGAWPRRAGT